MSRGSCSTCAFVAPIVGVALVLGVAVIIALTTRASDHRYTKPHLVCWDIAVAIDKYIDHPSNAKHDLPHTLNDLLQPPWGGPPLLQGGPVVLIDPWGKPFQMERRQRPDGEAYVLVWTTAPDGTRISQFGIGSSAEPE